MKSFITVDQEEGEKKRLNFHDSFDNFFPFSDLFLIKELCLIFPFFRSVLFFSSFCFSLFPLLISILILSVSFFISSHWVCTCLSPFSPSPCYSLLALFHILSCSTELLFLLFPAFLEGCGCAWTGPLMRSIIYQQSQKYWFNNPHTCLSALHLFFVPWASGEIRGSGTSSIVFVWNAQVVP